MSKIQNFNGGRLQSLPWTGRLWSGEAKEDTGGTQVPGDCGTHDVEVTDAERDHTHTNSDDGTGLAPAAAAAPARRSWLKTGPCARATVGLASVILPALGGLGLWLSSPNATPTQGPLPDLEANLPGSYLTAVQPSAVASIEAEAAPQQIGREVTLNQGDTLLKVLLGMEVSRSDALQAINALEEVFDPRQMRSGQSIRVALAPSQTGQSSGQSDGEAAGRTPETRTDGARTTGETAANGDAAGLRLVSLAFQPSAERDIRVDRDDDSQYFVANAIDRQLFREIVGGSGIIQSSLFTAGQHADVPTPVMIELIRAFSYDVDFQREVRQADDFELLYESHYDEDGNLAKTGAVIYAGLTLSGRRLELYRFTPKSGNTDYFHPDGVSVRRALLRTPVDGARVSSGYGMRMHPILGYSKMHRGVDFAAPTGTPVYAAGDGIVEVAGRKGAYGNYIRLRHFADYRTAYAHLSRYARGIKPGTRVKQGQVIGYVGSTGRSTGPHLHYEVLRGTEQLNPANLKLPDGERLKGEDLQAFQAARARIDRLRNAGPERTLLVQASCPPETNDGTGLQFHIAAAENCAGPLRLDIERQESAVNGALSTDG